MVWTWMYEAHELTVDGDEFLTATDIGNTKMMLKAWIMSVSSHVLVINGDLFTKRYGV